MSIKPACFNENGLRDQSKAAHLSRDLFLFGVNVAAIKETPFVCNVDACMLPSDFVVYSEYGD